MRFDSICTSALLVATAIAGCGAASSRASNPDRPRAGGTQYLTAQPTCGLDDQTMSRAERIEVPGTQVALLLPRPSEMVLMRGMPIAAHPCGLTIAVVAAPAHPAARFILDAAVMEAQRSMVNLGASCQLGRSGNAWRCTSRDGIVALMRRFGPDDRGALVTVIGPADDERAIRRIAGSAEIDPALVFDPLAQMSISLSPPAGMVIASDSTAGHVRYEVPNGDGQFTADVSWSYRAFDSLEGHDDGRAWDIREMGHVGGELVGEHADSIDRGSLTPIGASEDGGFFEASVEGVSDGMPVTFYLCAIRDTGGVFYAIGRVRPGQLPGWLPRLRAHAETLRVFE